MLNKLPRLFHLLRRHKGDAFRILWSAYQAKPFWIKVHGRRFYQNFDRSTFFHLHHSYPKVEGLIDTIPDQIEGAIIDGGANNGLFSFHAALKHPSNPVFAFEPSPLLQPILEKNLEPLGVQVEQMALAEAEGTLDFFYSPDSDQIGSFILENVEPFAKDPANIQRIQVPTIGLDQFVEKEEIEQVGVLKLDVQGAELSVLQGATKTLERTDHLLVEVFLIEETVLEMIELIRGYFPYHRAVNPVIYGADLHFSKAPFED